MINNDAMEYIPISETDRKYVHYAEKHAYNCLSINFNYCISEGIEFNNRNNIF